MFGDTNKLKKAMYTDFQGNPITKENSIKLDTATIISIDDFKDEDYDNNIEKYKAFSKSIKKYVKENGAVFYGGQISGWVEKEINYNGKKIKTVNQKELNGLSGHAMTIIGWDDNFSKDNFDESVKPNSDGALILKNSWGEETGYYYMSYEYAHTFANYMVMKWSEKNKNENIYYADSYLSTNDTYWIQKDDYSTYGQAFGNVFKIQKDKEEIKAITYNSYIASDYSTQKANIKIYKTQGNLVDNINDSSKTLLFEKNNVKLYIGTNKILVDPPITVNKNDFIFIEIEPCDEDIENNVKFIQISNSDANYIPHVSYKNVDGTWYEMDGLASTGEFVENLKGNFYIKLLTDTIEDNTIYSYTYKLKYNKLSPTGDIISTFDDTEETDFISFDKKATTSNVTYEFDGYTHIGWSNIINDKNILFKKNTCYTGKEFNNYKDLTEDETIINLYPVWQANTYRVKYEVDDAYLSNNWKDYYNEYCLYSANEYTFTDEFVLPDYKNYFFGGTFNKWVNINNGQKYDANETVSGLSQKNNNTIILKAEFINYKFEVQFKNFFMDESFHTVTPPPTIENIEYNISTISIPSATCDNYKFLGWSLSSINETVAIEGNTEISSVDFVKLAQENFATYNFKDGGYITLFPVFSKINCTYKLKYNLTTPINASNVATGNINDTEYVNFDNKIKTAGSGFSLIGWTLKGWSLTENNNSVDYDLNTEYSAIIYGAEHKENAIVNLYPVWQPNTYKINFTVDNNISNTQYNQITATYDQNVTLPTFNDPNLFHISFIGWEYNGETYANNSTLTKPNFITNGSMTFNAKFQQKTIKIKFNLSTPSTAGTNLVSGVLPGLQTCNTEKINIPSTSLTLNNHTFKGWSLTKNGELKYPNGINDLNIIDFLNTANITSPFLDGTTINLYTVFEKNPDIIINNDDNKNNNTSIYKGGSNGGGSGGSSGRSITQKTTSSPLQNTLPSENTNNNYSDFALGPATRKTMPVIKDGQIIKNVDSSLSYKTKSGTFLKGWQKIEIDGKEKMFFYTQDNKLFNNGFIKDSLGDVYHCSESGEIDTNKKIINGKEFNFDKNGRFVGNKDLIKFSKERYLETYTGSWTQDTISKKWKYNMKNSDGELKFTFTNGLYSIVHQNKEKIYMFNNDGTLLTGLQKIDNRYFIFDTNQDTEGELLYEIVIDSNGNLNYINPVNLPLKISLETGFINQ